MEPKQGEEVEDELEELDLDEPEDEVEGQPKLYTSDDLFGEKAPEQLKKWDEFNKDFSISEEEFDALPVQAKHAIANLRRAMTQGTQRAAVERKSAMAEKEALAEERARVEAAKIELQESRMKFLDFFGAERLQRMTEEPEEEEPRAYTEEWFDWKVKQRMAVWGKDFLGQFGAISEEEKAKLDSARAAAARATEESKLEAFVAAHSDFQDHFDKIKELRHSSNFGLSVERCYELAKAEAVAKGKDSEGKAERQVKTEMAEAQRASRRAVSTGRLPGSNFAMPDVKHMSGSEVAEWLASHPDALDAVKAGRL